MKGDFLSLVLVSFILLVAGANSIFTPPNTIFGCIDTDGGKNWDVQGTCKDITGTYIDSCGREPYAQNAWLKEYYCENDVCKPVYKYCWYSEAWDTSYG
ncbi:MAG: hypothetical protein J7L23_04195, partial [Candidatus Diapherotrites archaeon]|nr:hypothetical protein [Candidatus Diapherotrites archaeon]